MLILAQATSEHLIMNDIYEPQYVQDLFNKMSRSYERVNYITSFGFSSIWRKQMARKLDLSNATVVVDLMSGMGECWKPVLKQSPENVQSIAVDFSSEMVNYARKYKEKKGLRNVQILQESIFENSIPDHSASHIISGFGLKTFSESQLRLLASEVDRLLQPGGTFVFIDVSVPSRKLLRIPYLFYLKRVIPVLGKLFLGDPATYKMLGVYTQQFQDARKTQIIFDQMGFETTYQRFFFGCASGFSGKKN